MNLEYIFKWQLIFAFFFLIGMSGCTKSEPTLTVEKVEVREIEFPPEPGKDYPVSRINRPYFDEKNQLQWNNDKKNPRICGASSQFECRHKVVSLKPRVDYCCCPNNLCTTEILIGLDDKEKIIWQRDLKRYNEHIIGVSQQTLVLSTLEVIDPKNGTILEPLITEPNRKWAKYGFHQPIAAAFRRKTKDFILFDAEYSLVSTQGGLYLFNPKREVRTLIKKAQQVSPFPFRIFLPNLLLQIRNIALSEDERFAFLAQSWETRGPFHVEFAIFDIEKKRTVFKERLDNNCSHPDAIIVVGKNGHVAMSYDCKRKHILVHYWILP